MGLKHRLGKILLPKLPVTRFFVELVRIEVQAAAVRTKNRCLPGRRRRLRRLYNEDGVLVNVACGPFVLPGFCNLDLRASRPDVIEVDCGRRLPLRSGSASGIRAEHFVEHLETQEELPVFLRECHRALVDEGVLRIVVLDGERYLQAYCRDDLEGFRELAVPEPFPEDLATRMDVVKPHFSSMARTSVGLRLRNTGPSFGERRLHPGGADGLRELSPSELARDREEHAPYSLYVDAVKTS